MLDMVICFMIIYNQIDIVVILKGDIKMDKQDKQVVGISPLLYQDGATKEGHSVSLNDGTHWTQQVIRGNSGLTLVNNGYWNTEISAQRYIFFTSFEFKYPEK